ncbi:hypothetical protein MKW94_003690 [Papaver nudicaule]|uniref:Rho termination factor N-terminal domain-containing protein n=1 Tax=Papaver nudicaule TaxID=74823 RepID=A0AA41VSC0_PAPNU|nr:hypothetical protein [Papaver nudicaule]
MQEVMDWDICGPLYSEDGKKYMEDGLKCIDYIDYWPDVIEEDAVNEKCCKEVLRKLIQKADNEIEELEGDLFMLQSQIEWADKNKYDEWFDICYKGLKENVQRLESSIFSLKDGQHEDDVHSKMHREPVRKIDEIIKALLSKESQDKHEQMGQPADSIPEEVISMGQPGDNVSEEVRSDQQCAEFLSKDLRPNEQAADILSRDLRSDEQPTEVTSEERPGTLIHSTGPSDSTTAETERVKSKFTSFTELSLCSKPNSDVSTAVDRQDSGDTITPCTSSIISSPMVPEHVDENGIQPLKFHGQELVELVIPVTQKAPSLIPSLELQQQQEKVKSEPSAISSKALRVSSNSSLIPKQEVAITPEIIVQSKQLGTQKTSATVTENRKGSIPYRSSKGTKKHKQNLVNGQHMPVSLGHNSTNDRSSSNSSLMLQKQMDKPVMQLSASKPLTSFTFEPFHLLPSSVMQGKARIKSEIHIVEEPESIAGVSVRRDSYLDSQRKIAQSVESKTQLFPLGSEKSGAALTGNMVSSASSSKSRGTQKRKQDQVEGRNFYKRSAPRTVSDDASLNSYVKSREKHKSRIIQNDGERVRTPMIASSESLSLPEPITYDGLNKLKVTELYKFARSLGLKGLKDCKKEALMQKILEARRRMLPDCVQVPQ